MYWFLVRSVDICKILMYLLSRDTVPKTAQPKPIAIIDRQLATTEMGGKGTRDNR